MICSTVRRHPRRSFGVFVALSLFAAPAHATISAPVEAMIREAARSGDEKIVEAVVKVAVATNPDDAEAIASLGAALLADAKAKAAREHEAQLASQGLFEGWSGEGQLGAGLTSGNSDETSAVIGLKLAKEGLRTGHKLTALVDYLRSNGVTTRQKYAIGYAFNYDVGDDLYLVGTLGWERDKFAGYARRFTESAGIGYHAIATDSMTLDLEAGPALRQARLIGGVSEDEIGGRGSLAWRWTISDGVALTEDASVLSASDNTTLISTSALTAKLSGALSARLSFNVQKETMPAPGRTSTDTATRATIVYGF